MENQEAATWRQWTNLLARVRFGSQKVAGKTLSGTLIKAVLERLATYADGDGTRVRPGIARIAIDMETSYTTVRNAITVGERVGLLRCVRLPSRVNAAEYELIIGEELLDKVELWTPPRYTLEVNKYREKYTGRHRTLTPVGSALEVAETGTLTPGGSALDATLTPTGSALKRSTRRNADATGVSNRVNADAYGSDNADATGVSHQPETNHKTYQPDDGDPRTGLTPPRTTPQDQTPDVSDLVNRPRCPHGRSPRRDHTGPRCPDCRAETTPAGCPTHGPAFTPGQRTDGKPACPLCRRTQGAAKP